MIEKFRTWRAFRKERRQRQERAVLAARMMILGGTLTMPRKR